MEKFLKHPQTYQIWFGIARSIRYHLKRRRFYELWNASTVVISVMGGSAAVSAIIGKESFLAIILSVVVALVSALDLAVGTGRHATLHADLARKFMELDKKIPASFKLSEVQLEELWLERKEIEQEEPPSLMLLDVLCDFEVMKSIGDENAVNQKIPFWRRWLANIFSQDSFARSIPIDGDPVH